MINDNKHNAEPKGSLRHCIGIGKHVLLVGYVILPPNKGRKKNNDKLNFSRIKIFPILINEACKKSLTSFLFF